MAESSLGCRMEENVGRDLQPGPKSRESLFQLPEDTMSPHPTWLGLGSHYLLNWFCLAKQAQVTLFHLHRGASYHRTMVSLPLTSSLKSELIGMPTTPAWLVSQPLL